MMLELVIEAAVRKNFELSLGLAEIQGVHQKAQVSSAMDGKIADFESEMKRTYRIEAVKDIQKLRAQRDFFWRMGIDPTKVRPASEALLRRILQDKRLPRVSPIVDAYNLASVKTLLTFSAFEDLPDDWVCPDCGASKDEFEEVEERKPKVVY